MTEFDKDEPHTCVDFPCDQGYNHDEEKPMNVLAPIKPKHPPEISAEERARRLEAVDYARGSVRLEGFVVSPFAEELNRRYVDGEITRKELTAALLAQYTL